MSFRLIVDGLRSVPRSALSVRDLAAPHFPALNEMDIIHAFVLRTALTNGLWPRCVSPALSVVCCVVMMPLFLKGGPRMLEQYLQTITLLQGISNPTFSTQSVYSNLY